MVYFTLMIFYLDDPLPTCLRGGGADFHKPETVSFKHIIMLLLQIPP